MRVRGGSDAWGWVAGVVRALVVSGLARRIGLAAAGVTLWVLVVQTRDQLVDPAPMVLSLMGLGAVWVALHR